MRIGIDIGGMSIKLGLVDEKFQIVAKKVVPTDQKLKDQDDIVKYIADAVMMLVNENHITLEQCDCIGLACPGTVDPKTGVLLYSNNLEWENIELLELMKRQLSVPLAIANDADAAALGEVLCGAAKNRKSAILLTLGTGVGGSVILDGKIFTGTLRGGCELGHMSIQPNGRLCTCGRRGCLEQYASATALMKSGRMAARRNKESLLGQLCNYHYEQLNGKHIFMAAEQGDVVATKVIDQYEEKLSFGIANLVNIFRPEVVIIGGGVSAQGKRLTEALQRKVKPMCFGGEYGEVPPIVTSELGNDAGIIGAAYLIQ